MICKFAVSFYRMIITPFVKRQLLNSHVQPRRFAVPLAPLLFLEPILRIYLLPGLFGISYLA